MMRTVSAILMSIGLSLGLAACSTGDYSANPSDPANGSVNPLNPLNSSQFTWAGTPPMSALVNGGGFQAKDTGSGWTFDYVTGGNYVVGVSGTQIIKLYLVAIYKGNLYSLGRNSFYTYAMYANLKDSLAALDSNDNYYYSYLGNSGEVLMTENDSLAIGGKFYFQGVNKNNKVVTVSNGFFSMAKF